MVNVPNLSTLNRVSEMKRKLSGTIISRPATMWVVKAINTGLTRRSSPILAEAIKEMKIICGRLNFFGNSFSAIRNIIMKCLINKKSSGEMPFP